MVPSRVLLWLNSGESAVTAPSCCRPSGVQLVVDHADPAMPQLCNNFLRATHTPVPREFAEAPAGVGGSRLRRGPGGVGRGAGAS